MAVGADRPDQHRDRTLLLGKLPRIVAHLDGMAVTGACPGTFGKIIDKNNLAFHLFQGSILQCLQACEACHVCRDFTFGRTAIAQRSDVQLLWERRYDPCGFMVAHPDGKLDAFQPYLVERERFQFSFRPFDSAVIRRGTSQARTHLRRQPLDDFPGQAGLHAGIP